MFDFQDRPLLCSEHIPQYPHQLSSLSRAQQGVLVAQFPSHSPQSCSPGPLQTGFWSRVILQAELCDKGCRGTGGQRQQESRKSHKETDTIRSRDMRPIKCSNASFLASALSWFWKHSCTSCCELTPPLLMEELTSAYPFLIITTSNPPVSKRGLLFFHLIKDYAYF